MSDFFSICDRFYFIMYCSDTLKVRWKI